MSAPLLVSHGFTASADRALSTGAMVGGWLISGPPMIGKATAGRALAAAVLSGAARLDEADPHIAAQIEQGAHPDFITLSRTADEKTGVLRRDIRVEDVRGAISRFQRTSATGRRVLLIDRADEMNRNAANALLKTLEEPPAGALLLLATTAPGRLLPTIRSRCRRLSLAPLAEDALAPWLTATTGVPAEEAAEIAKAAKGRPGRARSLAEGEGREALALANNLLDSVLSDRGVIDAANRFGRKDMAEAFGDARDLVLDRVADGARALASGATPELRLPGHVRANDLVAAHDEMAQVARAGAAVNVDRVQIALGMAMALNNALRGRHAGR